MNHLTYRSIQSETGRIPVTAAYALHNPGNTYWLYSKDLDDLNLDPWKEVTGLDEWQALVRAGMVIVEYNGGERTVPQDHILFVQLDAVTPK